MSKATKSWKRVIRLSYTEIMSRFSQMPAAIIDEVKKSKFSPKRTFKGVLQIQRVCTEDFLQTDYIIDIQMHFKNCSWLFSKEKRSLQMPNNYWSNQTHAIGIQIWVCKFRGWAQLNYKSLCNKAVFCGAKNVMHARIFEKLLN